MAGLEYIAGVREVRDQFTKDGPGTVTVCRKDGNTRLINWWMWRWPAANMERVGQAEEVLVQPNVNRCTAVFCFLPSGYLSVERRWRSSKGSRASDQFCLEGVLVCHAIQYRAVVPLLVVSA